MAEKEKRTQKQQSDEQITYAYNVIDSLVEGMDKVTAEPRLAMQFYVEVLMKMPEIVDAIMPLVNEEHRELIGKFLRSMSRMGTSCLKQIGRR